WRQRFEGVRQHLRDAAERRFFQQREARTGVRSGRSQREHQQHQLEQQREGHGRRLLRPGRYRSPVRKISRGPDVYRPNAILPRAEKWTRNRGYVSDVTKKFRQRASRRCPGPGSASSAAARWAVISSTPQRRRVWGKRAASSATTAA